MIGSLPEVHLPPELGLLTRWLRLAGVVSRATPELAGLLATDGSRHFPLDLIPSGGTRRRFLLTDSSWRQQLAQVLAELELPYRALHFLALCPRCGAGLAPEPPGEAGGILYACTRCPHRRGDGPALRSHVRQLRDLYLEHLFACDRCGQGAEESHQKSLLKLELVTGPGPVSLPEEDLERDLGGEIAALLQQIEAMSEEDLEDGVAYHRERMLCGGCRRQLIRMLREFFREGSPA